MLKYVFFGALPGGEIWESGFWAQGATISSADNANSAAAFGLTCFLGSDFTGFFGAHGATSWNTKTSLLGVRTYFYPTGTGPAEYVGLSNPTSPVNGAQTDYFPNQLAQCFTLETGLAGRRNRGRMYIPYSGGSLDSNGLFATGNVGTDVVNLAHAFTLYQAGSFGTAVVSSAVGSTAHLIESVSCDQRPDIQRRRADRESTGIRSRHSV